MLVFPNPAVYEERIFVMRRRKKKKIRQKRSYSADKFQVDLFPLAKRFSETGKHTAHYVD